MKINNTNNQNFGMKIPTIFSKAKMQTAIENITHVSKNNKVEKSAVFYSDKLGFISVFFKYIATKLGTAPKK